jgi:putative ABC transport system permease protein
VQFDSWEQSVHHLRHAYRMLKRERAFTLTVLATLSVAIGATTAAFAVVHAVLLRPLPVADQQRLVVLLAEDRSQQGATIGMPNEILWSLAKDSRSFNEIAGIPGSSGVAPPSPAMDGQRAISLASTPVTGNLFHVLGVTPALGRVLQSSDDEDKAGNVAVLSNEAWHREFGGRPDIVGHTLKLSQGEFTVVGVTPVGFNYPSGTDLWISFPQLVRRYGEMDELGSDGGYWDIVARVRDGVSEQQVRAEFLSVLRASKSPPLGKSESRIALVRSFESVIVGNTRPRLLLMLAAVTLVLLMACINVSGLILTRGLARSGELAVRAALGADRRQLVRQLMIENSILGGTGGILGAAVALGIIVVVRATVPPGLPRFDELRLDPVTLLVAMLLTVGSVLLFGLIPAFASARTALSSAVTGASRNFTGALSTARARSYIVVVQVALAVVLLTVAGLLGRTLTQLQRIELGFNPKNLLYVLIERLDPDVGEDMREARQRHNLLMYQLLDRLPTLPGIRGAAPTHVIPFSRVAAASGQDLHFSVQGGGIEDALHSPVISFDVASESYFQVLGIRILRGRAFTGEDGTSGERVAIVSESFARLAWPGINPLGRQFRVVTPDGVSGAWRNVVGIAADTRYRDLISIRPTVYIPTKQSGPGAIIAIRTSGDPIKVVPSVRGLVSEIDHSYAVGQAYVGDAMLNEALALPNFIAVALQIISGVALLLAALGLFGVLSLLVRQRTRELAVRSALGATATHIRVLVLRQAALVTGSGIGVGLLLAVACARAIRSQLFEISFADPATLVLVVMALSVVASGAAFFPARAATQTDPLVALKGE